MSQVVKLKRTAVEGKVPTTGNIELGELAINTYDGRIFFEKDNGTPSIQQVVTTNSQTTGSLNILGDVTASIFFGTINSTNGVVSGSSQLTSSYDARYLTIGGDGVISGSSQVSYVGLSNIPVGIVSGSSQIIPILPSGVISGSSQLTASFDTRYINTNGDGVISGSSQVSYTGLSNIPSGIVSGSSQVVGIISSLNTYTASNDTTNTTQNSRLNQLSTASGSAISRLTSLESATGSYETRGRGIVSGSSQITYSGISSIPTGIVSGSSQVVGILSSLNTYTSSNDTTNTTQNSRLTSLETASGSAISRLNVLEIETANLEAFTGSINTTIKNQLNVETVVSGSSQITLSSTTGFSSFSSSVDSRIATEKTRVDAILLAADADKDSFAEIVALINSVDTTNDTAFASFVTSSNATNNTQNSRLSSLESATGSYETQGRGIVSGSAQVTPLLPSGVVSGSGQVLGGTGIVSGSSQITYSGISSIPAGIVSGSSQVTPLLPTGVVSGSSQVVYTSLSSIPVGIVSGSAQVTPLLPTGVVSGSGQINVANTTGDIVLGTRTSGNYVATITAGNGIVTSGATTGEGIAHTLSVGGGVVSGSSQITYANISSIPAGIVSGSAQITPLLPTGIVSGSAQVVGILSSLNSYTSSNDTTNTTQNNRLTSLETASGSALTRLSTLEIETANLEAFTGSINTTIKTRLNAETVVSGSSQIVYTSLSSIPAGIVSGSSQVTPLLPSGVVSGSSQINADSITNFDSNVKEKLDADGVLSGSVINGNKTFSNDVIVSGNLTVNGTTTTVNSNTVNIGDNILILNSDETGTPSQNGGIEIERGTSTNASLIWNESIDQWQVGLSGSEISLVDVSSTQSLFNKTINGGSNTISNIGNTSLTNSSITIAGTSTALGGSITAATILQGTGVVSGSSQITYSGISSIPAGIVSGSAQVTPLLPTGVVSGSSQVVGILSSLNTYTGSNNTTNNTQNSRLDQLSTASGSAITRLTALEVETANLEAFTGSINTTIKGQLNANTVVSGSSQVSYIGLSNIPAGIVSGSSQITSLLPTGVVSGSSQVINSLINQSVNLGTGAITASFFKGDGSQLTNLPPVDVSQVATVTASFHNQSSVSVNHNFNTKNVIVSVYQSNDTQIIPQSVTLTNNNTLDVVLSGNHSGYVVVAKGGHIVSGSAFDSNLLNGQPGSYYLNYSNFTNIPSGIISSSAQIDTLFNIDGLISGASQITNLTTYKQDVSGSSTYAVSHSLNEEYPIVQAWNTSTKKQELPSIVESTSINSLTLTFSSTFSGRIIVKK